MTGKNNYNNIGLWPSGLRVDIKLLSNSVANCYIVNHHNYFDCWLFDLHANVLNCPLLNLKKVAK